MINATFLPRLEGGEDSVANVKTVDGMAPIPNPAKNRNIHNHEKVGTKAHKIPAVVLRPSPNKSNGRLPH